MNEYAELREFLNVGIPELVKIYTLRTRLDCASKLFEVGGMNKREFAAELGQIRKALVME